MDTTVSKASSGQGLRAAIVLAAAGSAGAGLIHAAAAGSHEGAQTLVWMFAACAAFQLGWAAVVVLVPTRNVLFAGAAINGAALATWIASRTVGVSWVDALAEPEAIGMPDLFAAVFAGVAVAASVLAITQPISLRSIPNGWAAAIVVATVVLAMPALAAGHTHGGHDHLADEHIHAVGASANTDAHEPGHGHEGEAAAAVEHSDEDGHHASDAGTGGTTSTTHGHAATPVGTNNHNDDENHHGTTPPTSPGSPAAPPHGHDPTDPSHHPTNPPTTSPPHAHPPPTVTPTGPIVTVTDPRLSATQQRDAGTLLLSTLQAMKAFPTVAAVQAAGYQSIGDGGTGFEHFVHWTYFSDTSELNPQRIESIVAQVGPNGVRTVVSAMYILRQGKTMADVPDIAGSLTTWHDHQDLCWTTTPGGGNRVTGRVVNGQCPNGGVNVATPPMLHVWLQPQPCGPFAGIEGTHGSACGHGH